MLHRVIYTIGALGPIDTHNDTIIWQSCMQYGPCSIITGSVNKDYWGRWMGYSGKLLYCDHETRWEHTCTLIFTTSLSLIREFCLVWNIILSSGSRWLPSRYGIWGFKEQDASNHLGEKTACIARLYPLDPALTILLCRTKNPSSFTIPWVRHFSVRRDGEDQETVFSPGSILVRRSMQMFYSIPHPLIYTIPRPLICCYLYKMVTVTLNQ